jgi:tetratricopeptide (TPR) repeat protein/predicted Ser/Thr protein kinase
MTAKDKSVATAATVSPEASAPTVSASASAATVSAEASAPIESAGASAESDAIAETVAAATGAAAPLRRGAALGRYVVLEKLGGGGMGVVYTAYDPELDRRIAIKLLRPSAQGASADARTRLLREAQALARLSHPNVIAVHDVGMLDGQVFVAMEYVEGETLRAWLQRERRTWLAIRDAYLQAGRGLAAAHAVGIVHRDFKPENVLVGHDGRVRVLDFGLARADELASKPNPDMKIEHAETIASAQPGLATPLTSAGEFLGTPAYSSPEQLQGEAADARSDQFSFCVALHEALYGARPFEGSTFGELVVNVLGGAVIAAPAGTRVPPRMRTPLLRGLSGPPAERYPTIEDLLTAISYDPAAPRRRALIAGSVIVLAGTVGYAVWMRPHDTSHVCESAGARLDGIWDDARRSEIARAFSATGAFGAGATHAVAPLLDTYAKRWTEMSTEACVATRIHGEQSDELLDLREFCLTKRLAALQATTDLFAHADGKIAQNAVVIAQRLPPIDDCADIAQLRAVVKPPTDPLVRAEVGELERAIAKARQLSEAGKPKDASAALPALAMVQAIHYRPLEASLLATRGLIEYRATDLQRSIVTLTDGILAAESAGDDRLAAAEYVDVMGDLADVHQLDDARLAGRHASALIERMGGDPRLEGKLLLYQGWIEVYAEKDGRSYFDRALQIRQRALSPDDPDVLESLEIAARFYRGDFEFDKAMAINQRLLVTREHLYGPDTSPVADSLSEIGLLQRWMGDPRAAVATLSRALAIYDRAGAETWAPRRFTLRCLALVHAELGDREQAVDYAKQALAFPGTLGPVELPMTLEAYAIVLRRQGDYAGALAQIERALDLLKKTVPPTSMMFTVELTELGLDRLGLGHPSEALEPLERAMAIVEAYKGQWNSDQVAQARFALARVLRALGKDESRARDLATAARAEWSRWGKGKAPMVEQADAFLGASR